MKSITIIGFLICVLTAKVIADIATEVEENIYKAFQLWVAGDPEHKIPFHVPPIEPLPVPPFCDNIDKLGVRVYIETGLLEIFGLKVAKLDSAKVAKTLDEISLAASATELRLHSDKYSLNGKALYVYNVKGKGTLDIKLHNVQGTANVHIKPTSTGTEIDHLAVNITVESAEGNLENASWPINNLINTRGRQLVAAFQEEINRVVRQQVDRYFKEPLSKIKFADLPQYFADILAGKYIKKPRRSNSADKFDNSTVTTVENGLEDSSVSAVENGLDVSTVTLVEDKFDNSTDLRKISNDSVIISDRG